jgi:hypothetical protein
MLELSVLLSCFASLPPWRRNNGALQSFELVDCLVIGRRGDLQVREGGIYGGKASYHLLWTLSVGLGHMLGAAVWALRSECTILRQSK